MDSIFALYRAAEEAALQGSWVMWLLAFLVGLVSSAGPCTPSRLLWLAQASGRAERPRAMVSAFVAGTVTVYAAFGVVGSLFADLLAVAPIMYALLGVTGIVVGLVAIWKAEPHCEHVHASTSSSISLGSAFLQGCAFAALIQPCCLPMVGGVVMTVAPQKPLIAAGVLAVFGLGHAVPAFAVAPVRRAVEWARQRGISQAAEIVMAAISITIGLYYLVLA